MFRRLASVLTVVLFTLLLVAARGRADDPVFQQIDSIVKKLSDITGLAEEHPVPYGRMSKHQLHQFLSKRIKHTLRPEEIRADELALKMFGLVPQDFDLKKSTIDLLTEQAAAFYDYDEKRLFLLNGEAADTEVTTLAHELAHALADQHFNLSKYMDESPANDDENLARTAVVEGQASWLMLAYDLEKTGQPPVPTPEMLKMLVDSSASSFPDYPVLKASPLYIQQSLLFPYTAGTAFFDAVYKRDGKQAFSAVFRDPPKSTAEVMHPALYLDPKPTSKPELPSVPANLQSEEISEGSVGEFDHTILLWQYQDEARARSLAPHVRGGQFKIVREASSHLPLLLYGSSWDSPSSAHQFFAAYQDVLQHKWKHFEIAHSDDDLLTGRGDNGYFAVRVNDNHVTSVEGLKGPDDWKPPAAETRLATGARVSFSLARRHSP